jgi:hypothetical protein
LILYGEALPVHSAVPIGKDGVDVDTESLGTAQMFLERARQGLIVRKR